MSASTTATWGNIGSSGNWTDSTQWVPASVPGAGNTVLIGNSTVTTATPWTVTVAGAQAAENLGVGMGSSGTLSIAGALSVAGQATVGYAAGDGVTVELGAGASLGVSSLIAAGSVFQVNGGTITTGSYADLGQSSAVLQAGGAWNAEALYIGNFATGNITVGGAGGAGTITASATIGIGSDGTTLHPYSEGSGALDVIDGSVVSAPLLGVVNNSLLSVDSQSAVVIGGGPATAGAVEIGSAGTLALEWGEVAANVVDGGALTALINPGAAGGSVGPGPVITGTLSGDGSVQVGSGYMMEVGSAAGFAGSVTVDAGAVLMLDAGAAPGGPISMAGGTIDLAGLTFGTGQALAYDTASGVLTVGSDSLDVGTGLSLARFSDQADTTASAGTLVMETACYAAGTRIAGAHGEVAVETLRPGDHVRTAGGRIAPVRWVGQATLDVRRHEHAAPVRIAAGAFAPGVPRRDLLVSGDHAIAVGGVLIPARKLVNGATIRTDRSFASVTYVHVELDRHDLLLAEGLAAESFLDTGNRGQLDGSAAAAARFGADPQAAALRIFAEHGCAPLVLRGKLLETAQAHLMARAEGLGWRLVTDPALTIEADRTGTAVVADGPDALQVVLPPGTRQVRLLSRSFVPAVLDPAIPDGRQLGVALALELDEVSLDASAFDRGWYAADAGVSWRWTDGAATLVLPGRARSSVLTVHVVGGGARYWVAGEPIAQAA